MTARWLNPAEAAQHSGYSVYAVGDALREGELRGYQRKPGGHWRIAIEDLDAWVKGEPMPEEQFVPVVVRR